MEPCSLRELAGYFVRLGTVGFGGPIALAGFMQRDLVERRRWISERDCREVSRSRSWHPVRSRLSWRSTSDGRVAECRAGG